MGSKLTAKDLISSPAQVVRKSIGFADRQLPDAPALYVQRRKHMAQPSTCDCLRRTRGAG